MASLPCYPRSTTRTRAPRLRSAIDNDRPMIPPPMMMTSQVFTDCIVKGVEPRVRPLQLAQEIHNFRLLPIHRANEFSAKHAIAIDDVSLGKFERAIEI